MAGNDNIRAGVYEAFRDTLKDAGEGSVYKDPAGNLMSAVAEGVHDAFLTVLTTGDGFGPDYPFSREDLLAAVTEGVRQAFEPLSSGGDDAVEGGDELPTADAGSSHRFHDDGNGYCETTMFSLSGNSGYLCSEPKTHPVHRAGEL